MERVNFYFDGFNFYHGLRKRKLRDPDWQQFYWIDFVKFAQQFILDNQSLQKVYYFTAPLPDIDKLTRQRLLFKVNSLINGNRFEVIDGKFFPKTLTCKVCNSTYTTHEEKYTDVNIATQMLEDCFLKKVDTIVLVSADSDLLPPLKRINALLPEIKIRVYFPPDNRSDALYNFMKAIKKHVVELGRNKQKFINSVLPDTVDKDGTTLSIPARWKLTPKPSSAPSQT